MSSDQKPSRIGDTHIFVGGKPHAKNRGMLRDYKINYVLNMTPPRKYCETIFV